jgi:hypothetical protein
VDRGHRELPIRADYAGKTLTTARDEMVQVLLAEEDGRDAVMLLARGREPAPKPAARSARTTAASRPKARRPRR